MAEHLFDLTRRFDSLDPEGKHKQQLNTCMKQLCCIKSNGSGIKEMSTNTCHYKKCSKKQPFSSQIFPAKCAELALLSLQ